MRFSRIPYTPSRVPRSDLKLVKAPSRSQKETKPHYRTNRHKLWAAEVVRRADGVCQDPKCKAPTRTGIRLFADHIKELEDGGAPFDLRNGLARCGSCHTRKTNEEKRRRLTTYDE